MAKPFLILQLRPETEASDNEFEAFLDKGRLGPDEVHRIRLDQEDPRGTLTLDDYAGVIVGGGPGCVSDDPATKDPVEARIEDTIFGLMPEITGRDLPFLGCCYGIGILTHHLGARVSKENYGEPVGPVACSVAEGAEDPLLDGVPRDFMALVGHKEAAQELPPGCVHLLTSEPCPFQMFRYGQNVYATQFHPEADESVFATRIRIYRDYGYFDPADERKLLDAVTGVDVRAPQRILRNFVARYRDR